MIKIVGINALGYGSPAKIMNSILLEAHEEIGAEVYSYYGFWGKRNNQVPLMKRFGFLSENILAKFFSLTTGYQHIWCFFSTKNLLRQIDQIKPDIIHLHNLHLWNINVPMLFEYIKKNNIRTVWTLHDCWGFTGQCTYFSEVNCEKWKTKCEKCPQINRYPKSFVDRTKRMYSLKKAWFQNVETMVLVTPSEWLKKLVESSFLKQYPVLCINNGIDIELFNYTKSNIKEHLGVDNKYIVLGVSLEWGHRKGLDIFVSLSKILSDAYVIILVGVDPKIKKTLPTNIITIERTQNQNELAQLYSVSDVFLNPTREDNFPTVNIEALACGTPVITSFNGGSPEMITPKCGMVIYENDIDSIKSSIESISERKIISRKACRSRALEYDAQLKFKEYTRLYLNMINGEEDFT